jgi:nucleotide-binding universal stress UspA family protein
VIVVGVDRSPAAAAALRWAVDEAECRGTAVKAVFAWQRPLPFGWRTIPPELLTAAALRRAAALILERAVDEALAGRHARVRREAIEGPAAETLVAAARDAELLVVGTRRHHAPNGSTAAACLARARCPVVVVHEDPAAQRGRAALVGLLLRHHPADPEHAPEPVPAGRAR